MTSAEETKVYELRTYFAEQGKLDTLHARFRDHALGLFEKHGMKNVGYWVPLENTDNSLIYLLEYPSRASRDASWEGFMADADWKTAYAESTKDGKLVSKVVTEFLGKTDYSPALLIVRESPTRLFELRRYTTNPGKLETLDARFRDHTVELFTKHGITNLIYTHPLPDQTGQETTLVYFVAHPDEAARKASFDAFRVDPRWQKARETSELNGKILIKNGVQSILLQPTDYSPMQ